MNLLRKALTTLICVFILLQSSTSVKADEVLSYTLDYTTVEGDNLDDYIDAIRVVQDGSSWQVWVSEDSETKMAGSFTGTKGSVTYSPSNIDTKDVVISIDLDSLTISVTWANRQRTINQHHVTVKMYPSPESEDLTMWCDIYLDGELKDTRKRNVNDDGSVDFGTYSVHFSGDYKIQLDNIRINSSGTAVVESEQISGGVITRQMGDGTRELTIFMEAYIPAQELELNYLEAMPMLTWEKAKEKSAQYTNEEIDTALSTGRLVLKNNGTGLTSDTKLKTTITVWDRLNDGAATGDGIYNVNTKPRTVQVICQYYDTNTTDCAEVKNLTRYWAVIDSDYSYSDIVSKAGTEQRNEWEIQVDSKTLPSFPSDIDDGQTIQVQSRAQKKTETGWIAYEDMEALKSSSDFNHIENEETRDATRFGYYTKGTWSDYVVAREAPSYFWYSGYETETGEEVTRYNYASMTLVKDWTTENLSDYDKKITNTETRSCNSFKTNGTACGYTNWTDWSSWSTTSQTESSIKDVQIKNYTRYKTRTKTPASCEEAGCATYNKVTKYKCCKTRTGIWPFYSYSDCLGYKTTSCSGTYKYQADKKTENGSCKTYKISGELCGYNYSDWSSYSDWEETDCTSTNTKSCDSRTEYRYRTRSAKSCKEAGCASWSDWTRTSTCTSETNVTGCRNVYQYYTLNWEGWSSWSTSDVPSYVFTKDDWKVEHSQYVRARTSTFKWTDWMTTTTCSGSRCPDEVVRTQTYSDVNGTPYQAKGTVYTNGTWSDWTDVPSSQTVGYSEENTDYKYRVVTKTAIKREVSEKYAVKGDDIVIGTKEKQTESDISYQALQMNRAYARSELLEEIKSGEFTAEYNELENENILYSEFQKVVSENGSWLTKKTSSAVSGDEWLATENFVPYIYIRSHYRAEYTTKEIPGYDGEESMTVSLTETETKSVDKSASGKLVKDESQSARKTKVIYFDYHDPLRQYEGNLPSNWDEETYEKFVTAMEQSVANDYEGEIRIVMTLDDINEMKAYIIEHPESLGDCDFLRHFAHIFETTSDELREFLDGSDSCRLE